MRHALERLLKAGKLDEASDMADSILRFLNAFGMERERDEIRSRVSEIVTLANANEEGLTWAEWLREIGRCHDEYRNHNLDVAYAGIKALLVQIEAQPQGSRLGPGSYEHCTTLSVLGLCLRDLGQSALAEERLREALVVIQRLIRRKPSDKVYVDLHGKLLHVLGTVLYHQGKYPQARVAFKEGLNIALQHGNLEAQAAVLKELGVLELKQGQYAEADLLRAALEISRVLSDPTMEALILHNLGDIATSRSEWLDAEQYYRKSVTISELLNYKAMTAENYAALAIVVDVNGRPSEAEGWCRRALELDEQIHPNSPIHSEHLNNLAAILFKAVQAGQAPVTRLAEAKVYAEQSLAISETLGLLEGVWKTLGLLAEIFSREGVIESARYYRCREREAFASFTGNCDYIDRVQGRLISDIAAAVNGDVEARNTVQRFLPQIEAGGWHIANATQRIWSGERDWHSLAENLDLLDALLLLRVLEKIDQTN